MAVYVRPMSGVHALAEAMQKKLEEAGAAGLAAAVPGAGLELGQAGGELVSDPGVARRTRAVEQVVELVRVVVEVVELLAPAVPGVVGPGALPHAEFPQIEALLEQGAVRPNEGLAAKGSREIPSITRAGRELVRPTMVGARSMLETS